MKFLPVRVFSNYMFEGVVDLWLMMLILVLFFLVEPIKTGGHFGHLDAWEETHSPKEASVLTQPATPSIPALAGLQGLQSPGLVSANDKEIDLSLSLATPCSVNHQKNHLVHADWTNTGEESRMDRSILDLRIQSSFRPGEEQIIPGSKEVVDLNYEISHKKPKISGLDFQAKRLNHHDSISLNPRDKLLEPQSKFLIGKASGHSRWPVTCSNVPEQNTELFQFSSEKKWRKFLSSEKIPIKAFNQEETLKSLLSGTRSADFRRESTNFSDLESSKHDKDATEIDVGKFNKTHGLKLNHLNVKSAGDLVEISVSQGKLEFFELGLSEKIVPLLRSSLDLFASLLKVKIKYDTNKFKPVLDVRCLNYTPGLVQKQIAMIQEVIYIFIYHIKLINEASVFEGKLDSNQLKNLQFVGWSFIESFLSGFIMWGTGLVELNPLWSHNSLLSEMEMGGMMNIMKNMITKKQDNCQIPLARYLLTIFLSMHWKFMYIKSKAGATYELSNYYKGILNSFIIDASMNKPISFGWRLSQRHGKKSTSITESSHNQKSGAEDSLALKTKNDYSRLTKSGPDSQENENNLTVYKKNGYECRKRRKYIFYQSISQGSREITTLNLSVDVRNFVEKDHGTPGSFRNPFPEDNVYPQLEIALLNKIPDNVERHRRFLEFTIPIFLNDIKISFNASPRILSPDPLNIYEHQMKGWEFIQYFWKDFLQWGTISFKNQPSWMAKSSLSKCLLEGNMNYMKNLLLYEGESEKKFQFPRLLLAIFFSIYSEELCTVSGLRRSGTLSVLFKTHLNKSIEISQL